MDTEEELQWLTFTEAMERTKSKKPMPANKRVAEFGVSVFSSDNTDNMWAPKEGQCQKMNKA